MSDPVIHMLHGHPAYWCPVCKAPHALDGRWKWNGDVVKPTFSAAKPGDKFSYLSYSTLPIRSHWVLARPPVKVGVNVLPGKVGTFKYIDKGEAVEAMVAAKLPPEWQPQEVRVPSEMRVYCHVYVRDGNIQVLPDSQSLKGQTLPLQPWDPEKWR